MTINPHPDCRPCAPNYLFAFEKWLQRPLSSVEASIILPLERLRSKNAAKRQPTRLYIDTTAETAPIARDILILYIRWISSVIAPNFNSCIVGRYRSEANDAVRRSYLNNQLRQNRYLLESARLTPERLASYRSTGWLRRLSPNISTASAKFIDHLRGKPVHTMLILDADQLGHSTEVTFHGYNYQRGRARYQTFRQVLQTAGALLPPIAQSLTIILGNPATHPRSVYARHRRRSADSLSPIFHVLTPTLGVPTSVGNPSTTKTSAPGATASSGSLSPSTLGVPTSVGNPSTTEAPAPGATASSGSLSPSTLGVPTSVGNPSTTEAPAPGATASSESLFPSTLGVPTSVGNPSTTEATIPGAPTEVSPTQRRCVKWPVITHRLPNSQRKIS